jgi:hypothetical protein
MTDTFFPTSTPAMVDEQAEKIADLQKRLIDNNRFNEACIDTFMNTLFNYLGNGDIDEAVAEELAGCFGRDLTRTVNVSITIHGEMEVNLPAGMTIDDLAEELDFGPNVHYATGIEVNYVDLSTVEIEEC